MAEIKQRECSKYEIIEDVEFDARAKILELLRMLRENSEERTYNDEKYVEFIHQFYKNLMKEFLDENYDQIIKYHRNSSALYRMIYEEVKKSPKVNLAFDLGRIIGSSQMANSISDILYNENTSIEMIKRISDGKDLKDIIVYCARHPMAYNQDLCECFNIRSNNLNKKMHRLLNFELVERHVSGRRVYYSITKNGRRVAQKLTGKETGYKANTSYEVFDQRPYEFEPNMKLLTYMNYMNFANTTRMELIKRCNYDRQYSKNY